MRILSATDSIFRMASEYTPWTPAPDPGHYADDEDWQKAHLWDHYTETGDKFAPYRGPTILHHPDLQYALDNGWRVIGGNKELDHQSRGETGSGSPYLYKIDKGGVIHGAHLNMGPEETSLLDEGHNDDEFGRQFGSAPAKNWRHLIGIEGGSAEGPESHETLKDLVDDEAFRSSDPTHKGYADFKPLPHYMERPRNESDIDFDKKHQHTIRRAWETGTNDPHLHWNDPIEDPYASLDTFPRGGRRRAPRQEPEY